MTAESPLARAARRHRRLLFDDVAELYASARPSHPDDAVDMVVGVAGLTPASRILEVGCGTGQLTERLVARGLKVAAIDIGPSMVAAARRRVGGSSVVFATTSYEDFAADDGSFDLVVAADAFHWIDPEVKFSKSARLLEPRGWLAVLSVEQRYDEPVESALLEMWLARSPDSGAWHRPRPTVAQALDRSGHFGRLAESTFSSRKRLSAASVLDLERTRATLLDWSAEEGRAFTDELHGHLSTSEIHLTEVVTVTLGQVVRHGLPAPTTAR